MSTVTSSHLDPKFEAAFFDTGRVYDATDLKAALRRIAKEGSSTAMVLEKIHAEVIWKGSSADALSMLGVAPVVTESGLI